MVIEGVVVPCKWDKKGRITGIAIAGYDETEIPVLMDIKGKEIIPLLHHKIQITGVRVKEMNKIFIRVDSFSRDYE